MADPSSSIFANDGVASDAGIRIKSPFDTSIFSVDKGIRASHPAVRRFHEITLPAARAIVHAAFARYKPMNVAVAFNGGKDCTVLVDLVMEALRESKSCLETSLEIRVIYIRSHLQVMKLLTENFYGALEATLPPPPPGRFSARFLSTCCTPHSL